MGKSNPIRELCAFGLEREGGGTFFEKHPEHSGENSCCSLPALTGFVGESTNQIQNRLCFTSKRAFIPSLTPLLPPPPIHPECLLKLRRD